MVAKFHFAFGPDGMLWVVPVVGSPLRRTHPANPPTAELPPSSSRSIHTRIDVKSPNPQSQKSVCTWKKLENSRLALIGIPITGELWLPDYGRDWLGRLIFQNCELNRATAALDSHLDILLPEAQVKDLNLDSKGKAKLKYVAQQQAWRNTRRHSMRI